MEQASRAETFWVMLGFAGQAVFAMRFIWQWIVSERRKQSVIPVGFWYFSLVGGAMITLYAVVRDPVLLPGQVAGLVVYVRNLMLIYRPRSPVSACVTTAEPAAELGLGRKVA